MASEAALARRGGGRFLSRSPWRRAIEGRARRRPYALFIVPALLIVSAVIVFPWLFTVFMSLNEWKVAQTRSFVGLANYG